MWRCGFSYGAETSQGSVVGFPSGASQEWWFRSLQGSLAWLMLVDAGWCWLMLVGCFEALVCFSPSDWDDDPPAVQYSCGLKPATIRGRRSTFVWDSDFSVTRDGWSVTYQVEMDSWTFISFMFDLVPPIYKNLSKNWNGVFPLKPRFIISTHRIDTWISLAHAMHFEGRH